MPADTEANTVGRQAHLSEVSAGAEGSSLLSTIAPGTPTPFPFRSSSVMLFSRSEASGIPQKSVIAACSSTTVARWSAASPVMLLKPTLWPHRGAHNNERHADRGCGQGRRGGLPQSVCFFVNGH